MRISIFGLGYVGAVTSACLARSGHVVTGVDVSEEKVAMINAGRSPIVEEDVDDIISEQSKSGHLKATTDAIKAVLESELSLICVGTPSAKNGSLEYSSIRNVCSDIGKALRSKAETHTIVVRSTVLPGTVRKLIIPLLEMASEKKHQESFSVAFNPEFMREGSSVKDFYQPPYTIVGAADDVTFERIQNLYADISAPLFRTSIEAAEMIKYASNIFHALKVTFANEIGALCKAMGVDSHEVMNVFCKDTKLNISPMYLKPGFAFGGSCLPKDLRALLYKAKQIDVSLPLLESVLPSNHVHLQRALDVITDLRKKRIGIFGLSFKAGTDDLRESPMVQLAETLLGKGYQIRIFDQYVSHARLMGSNRRYIEQGIPHLSRLMCDSLQELFDASEVLVVGNRDPRLSEALNGRQIAVVDLVRIADETPANPLYEGICW